MTTKGIRLEYSGYMIFAAKMASVVTGLIFQFMISRSLLPDHQPEYDYWFNIADVTAYFTLLAGVLPFWTMRFVARKKEGAIKTGIVANLGISVAAALIYALLVPIIISGLGISQQYLPIYLLVSLQIVELYSITILEACLQARIPQTIGYGLLVQQICKVAVGYVLIVRFDQMLWGAVAATIIAFAFQSAYYVKLLAPELRQRIKWDYVREWFKGSLISIYNVAGNQIAAYIFILLFQLGGEGARGRLGAATIIVNVITYSAFLAHALYPKLIAERRSEDITTSMKMVLMFAIPLTTGAIALSDSYITILTDIYTDAAPVLVILALDAFVMTVSGLFSSVLFGVETIDQESKISLRRLARSRIFVAFSLPYIHSLITIPTALYVLHNYALGQPLLAALCVSIINSSARLAMFIVLYLVVRKMIRIAVPWRSISKYVLAAITMGTFLYIIPHPTRIYLTLIETAIGGGIYIAVLMALEKEVRALPLAMWREVRKKPTQEA